MTKLNQLKKKIQEAVPEILFRRLEIHHEDGVAKIDCPITLEDVLIALKYTGILFGGSNNQFCKDRGGEITWLGIYWRLNKPLDQQSKETIDFLWELLCK